MILKAQNFAGYLDISAPERLSGIDGATSGAVFRRSVKAGDEITVPDEYMAFPNIKGAITAGFLVVLSYDSEDSSLVINAEAGEIASGISETSLSNLELEMEFKMATLLYYKEFTYTGSSLTAYNIYTNSSKTVHLFSKEFDYNDGRLVQTLLTRISDNETLTSTFAYDGSALGSVTRS